MVPRAIDGVLVTVRRGAMSMSIGLTFPLMIATGSVGLLETSSTELEAAKHNLRSLLLSNKGERLVHFTMGAGLRRLLFEPLDVDDLRSRVVDSVSSQVERWMPYITIDKVDVLLRGEHDGPAIDTEAAVRVSFKFVNKPNIRGTVEVLVA